MTNRLIALVARLAVRTSTNERGASAVEYGLLVILIAAVIVGGVTAVGQDLVTRLTDFVADIP